MSVKLIAFHGNRVIVVGTLETETCIPVYPGTGGVELVDELLICLSASTVVYYCSRLSEIV